MKNNPNTTDSSVFANAIEKLKLWKIPCAFIMKSRILGSIVDIETMGKNGWEFIPYADRTHCLWQKCLWMRKSYRINGKDFLVQLAISRFLRLDRQAGRLTTYFKEEESIAKMHGTDGHVYAFLRKVRFLSGDADILPDQDLGNNVPDAMIEVFEGEIETCIHLKWLSLEEDLHYQTDGFEVDITPRILLPSPFVKQLEILNAIICRTYRQSASASKWTNERLLVRLVRAMIEHGYAPDVEAELAEFPDGIVLSNFLSFWFAGAPTDGAAAHLLAFVLERAEADLLEPCNAISWKCISANLAKMGFLKEAVLAAERVLSVQDGDCEDSEFLWHAILEFLHGIKCKDKADAEEGLDLGWLLKILFSREEALATFEGFNTLLGLVMAENGSATQIVADIVAKDFGKKRSSTIRGDADSKRCRCMMPPNVGEPLTWQAHFAILSKCPPVVRQALANFPNPLLSRHWRKFDMPETPILGLSDVDMRYTLAAAPLREGENNSACDDISWTMDAKPVTSEDEWSYLQFPQIALGSAGLIIAHKLLSFRDDDSEVEMLWARGLGIPDNSDDDSGFQRFFPLAKPNTTNVVASVWETFPYPDGCLGEVRFRIGEGKSLYAVMPYFCADRDIIGRGVPLPAFVYGLCLFASHVAAGKKATTKDGHEIDLYRSRYILRIPDDKTMALCEFHGCVQNVRRVKVASQGEVLRIDIDVGEAIPCLLPVYVKEENINDGLVKAGDVIWGRLFLQIDCFPPDENTEAWIDNHKDGPGDEPPEGTEHIYPILISKQKTGEGGDGTTAKDLPDLDYVLMALERLEASDGCTQAVRLDPNPEGIDIVARIHGRLLKYHVVTLGGAQEAPQVESEIGKVMMLFVRISDNGANYSIEYLNFPPK